MADPADYYAEAEEAAQALPPYRQAQLVALIRFLRERGVASDDPAASHYLAPLLTPADRPRLQAESRTGVTYDPSGGNSGTQGDTPETRKSLLTQIAEWLLALASLRTLLTAPMVAPLLLLARDSEPPPAIPVTQPPVPVPSVTLAEPATALEEIAQFLFNWPLLAAIGVLLVLLFGFHVVWPVVRRWLARQRRKRLRRDNLPDRGDLTKLATQEAHARLFADGDIARAFNRLRRHRAVPSHRIDVRASIRATVAGGAWPTVKFARRRLSPDYLLFSERERPNDHLAQVAAAWRERLNKAGIECEHYEFFGAPNTVRQITTGAGKACTSLDMRPLDTVLSNHERAHAVVMIESFDAVPNGRFVPEWLTTAGAAVRLHHMNPRDKRHWGTAEAQLHALGMQGFTATVAGSADFADQVVLAIDEDEASQSAPETPGEPDLAAFFDAHRDLVLTPVKPDDLQLAQVIDTLERWLDREAFLWLRAVALFPTINSGFTFFAGAVMEDETLISHQRYLTLARLPWMRAASMPDWLRLALIETLSEEQLLRAAATAAAFLDPPKGALGHEVQLVDLRKEFEDPKRLKQLAGRLEGGQGGFSDRLLIEALKGQPPDKLAVVLSNDPLPPPPSPWWRSQPLLTAVAALLGSAALVQFAPKEFRDHKGLVEIAPRAGDRVKLDQPTPEPTGDAAEPVITESTPVPLETPTPTPTQAVKDFRLYIQYANPAQLGVADGLQNGLSGETLGGRPLVLPDLELRQGTSPENTQLRCFDEPGCAVASELLQRLAKLGTSATLVPWRAAGKARPGHLELWLGAGKPPKPPGPFNVFFDWDKADITAEAASILDNAVDEYKEWGPAQALIRCSTDTEHDPDYSMALTERQAHSVRSYLISKGVPASDITTESFGSTPLENSRVQPAPGVRELQLRRCEITLLNSGEQLPAY